MKSVGPSRRVPAYRFSFLMCRQLMLSARGLTMKNLRRITRFLKMKRGASIAVCVTSGKYVSFMKMMLGMKCESMIKECVIW